MSGSFWHKQICKSCNALLTIKCITHTESWKQMTVNVQDPHTQAECSLPSLSQYSACVVSLRPHTYICVFSAFLRLHLQRSECRGPGREYVTHSNSLAPSLTSQNVQCYFTPASYKVMAESSQYYLIAIPSVDMHKKRPEESQDIKIEVEKGRLRSQQLCGKEEWCVSHHMHSRDVSTLSKLIHTNYFRNKQ